MKLILFVLGAGLIMLGFAGSSEAFHSGGVAECDGCHSMHAPEPGGSFLLQGSDKSSTCMLCHLHAGDTGPNGYHVATADADMPIGMAPVQRTPGGDFGWLKKTYSFIVGGTVTTEPGDSHGHNIVAKDFGYKADTSHFTAPGGTFPSSQLGCDSCHDPHGKYRRLSTGVIAKTGAPIIGSGSYDNSYGNGTGNSIPAGQAVGVYRLLAGAGYTKAGITFMGIPPAVAPSTYNQAEGTNQVRVAYGISISNGHTTWSNWCATCHGAMHSTGNYVHPVDHTMSGTIKTTYTNYVSSGIMTGVFSGARAGQGPYSSLVPFTQNTGSYTLLGSNAKSDSTKLGGPTDGDLVSCMSCHRAHASGFPAALRWNKESEFITYVDASGSPVWPGTDGTPGAPELARGRTSSEMQAAYYDRNVLVFGAYQRSLCNKCHAKD